MGSSYRLFYSRAFDRDLDSVPAYDTVIIRARLAMLAYQAESQSRNRRRLIHPVDWCPEATWQLRVGDYRILYRTDESDVRVLRLKFKGRKTTEEMGR